MNPLDLSTVARLAARTALDARDFAGVTDLAGFMVGSATEPNFDTREPAAQRDVNERLLCALADIWLRVLSLEGEITRAKERVLQGYPPFEP